MEKLLGIFLCSILLICGSISGISVKAQEIGYTDEELMNMALIYSGCNYEGASAQIISKRNGYVSILVNTGDKDKIGPMFVDIDRMAAVGYEDVFWYQEDKEYFMPMVDLKEALFTDAFDIYSTFAFGGAIELDYSDCILDRTGWELYKMTFHGESTYTGIMNELRAVFSEEIIVDMLGEYEVHDNKIYKGDAARGGDITVLDWLVDGEIIEEKNSRIFPIAVAIDDDWDGEKDRWDYYTFRQENINGRWIFTEFPFFL